MKRFRVYLKEGITFTVEAERFTVAGVERTVKFFKSKDEQDMEIWIADVSVLAIIPEADSKA